MPTVLITGANRGLGLEFVRQYLADSWHVIAGCRDPQAADTLSELAGDHSRLRVVAIDVTDRESINRAAVELAGTPIDVLINNAGIFGPMQGDNDWRQNFGHIDYDIWHDVIAINTMGPVKMAEAFIDHVAGSEQKKIITISSSLGSIGDPERGMHLAYRTSKAAVNMAMATLADELASLGVIIGILDPGWCRTDMGGSGADYAPEDSVFRMRGVIADLNQETSGAFLRHDGYRHPW